MYNYNTVSGEARHIWHIATGHAMQFFNDLHYSNRCRFISIAWLVAIASLSYPGSRGLFLLFSLRRGEEK
jgi:hypothetical protein